MAQVIQLPRKSTAWDCIGPHLERHILASGGSPADVAAVLPQLRKVWDEMSMAFTINRPITIPGPLTDAQIEAIKEHAYNCV